MVIIKEIDEAFCTASYLKARHTNLNEFEQYAKFRISGNEEAVYYRDDKDIQADEDTARLLELKSANLKLLGRLNLSDYAAAEQEMKMHLDRLHEYNELKDAGQALLGRLAVLRETTTKALYADFGLELDD
jgi:Swi5